MTSCPIISPTSKAFDTLVLTAAVYYFGYSFLSRTLVIVLPTNISTVLFSNVTPRPPKLGYRIHQVILVPITNQRKARTELHPQHANHLANSNPSLTSFSNNSNTSGSSTYDSKQIRKTLPLRRHLRRRRSQIIQHRNGLRAFMGLGASWSLMWSFLP
jgi:hypothetical protein